MIINLIVSRKIFFKKHPGPNYDQDIHDMSQVFFCKTKSCYTNLTKIFYPIKWCVTTRIKLLTNMCKHETQHIKIGLVINNVNLF